MGTKSMVIPWGWGQMAQYYCGDGDQVYGNTAGMGTDGTVLPWGWGPSLW